MEQRIHPSFYYYYMKVIQLSLLPSTHCNKDGTNTTTTITTILPIKIDNNNNQTLTIMITT